MGESDFLNHENSKIWQKIRIRYCILKLLVSGPKSEQELLNQISLLREFLPVKNRTWGVGELSALLKASIEELIVEAKIKQRDIFNTSTKDKRIEWFLNSKWLSETRLLKLEINRVRELEEKELKAKAELERIKREKEEKERREQTERRDRERQIILNQERSTQNTKTTNDKSENSNSILNGILSLVVVLGGIYVIGKIGDSLNRAFTFPVFLITCLVVFGIYHLSKNNEK